MFNLLFFSVLYRQIFFQSTTLAIGTLFKTEQIRQFYIKNDIKKWRFCFLLLSLPYVPYNVRRTCRKEEKKKKAINQS